MEILASHPLKVSIKDMPTCQIVLQLALKELCEQENYVLYSLGKYIKKNVSRSIRARIGQPEVKMSRLGASAERIKIIYSWVALEGT
jgi:hypothetical protein